MAVSPAHTTGSDNDDGGIIVSESAESLVVLVEVGFHAGHQQNRMVIQHRIGLGQFKMTTLPHTHHAHSVLFPKVRILQLFSHQGSTVNRGFGDQDFVKPTDQVSVVVGAAYSASQKSFPFAWPF